MNQDTVLQNLNNHATIVGNKIRCGWVSITEPQTGKLLFKYDPHRRLIEVQRRDIKTVVDLTQYEAG